MISVTLNTEKHGMCFIGKYIFSHGNAGPIEIDTGLLTYDEANKFVYNYRRGVLAIDNVDELLNKTQAIPASSKKFITGAEMPVQQSLDPNSVSEQDELSLKKILRSPIDVIKSSVLQMSIAKIRKLVALEKDTKNRKKLLDFFDSILLQHQLSVKKHVGTEEIKPLFNKSDLTLSAQYLDNIEDVVESEIEQIVLNPMSTKE